MEYYGTRKCKVAQKTVIDNCVDNFRQSRVYLFQTCVSHIQILDMRMCSSIPGQSSTLCHMIMIMEFNVHALPSFFRATIRMIRLRRSRCSGVHPAHEGTRVLVAQDLDPITVRVRNEGNVLHFPVLRLFDKFHAAFFEMGAGGGDIGDVDTNVAETTRVRIAVVVAYIQCDRRWRRV